MQLSWSHGEQKMNRIKLVSNQEVFHMVLYYNYSVIVNNS